MNEGTSVGRQLRELQEMRESEAETNASPARSESLETQTGQNATTATRPEDSREHEVRTSESWNRDRQQQRENQPMSLFPANEAQGLRSRWESLQVNFIDEPREAVEEANRLVSETINGLTRGFASEREKLEQQWHRGEDVSTEDLRLALRRYRSFFQRLLAM